MLDTETSKTKLNEIGDDGKVIPVDNIIVCWSLAIRAYNKNIVTLYGRKPSDIPKCLTEIHQHLPGDKTIIYIHNLAYDWMFIRKFLFAGFGLPQQQLNTKSHYPIIIKFAIGIEFRDSLILSQRSLEKWGKDMNVDHGKANGSWDYDLLRNQHTKLTIEELHYIENDVLCGVECLDQLMQTLNKNITTMPFTATGIPRKQVQKIANQYHYHDRFVNIVPDYETQLILEKVYHGGFTHGNRHFINMTMENVQGYDFASSYPYCMLSEKFPMSRFKPYLKHDLIPDKVIKLSKKYGLIFKLCALDVIINDQFFAMPCLQASKCEILINPVLDNGRILSADYLSIWLNEIDLQVIMEHYEFSDVICKDVRYSIKQYLPQWFTDFIYQCFENKTRLKGGDPVQYAISKSVVNSLYGMCVQKPVKDKLIEDYETGEFLIDEEQDPEEQYNKYVNRRNSVLPYQWGIWVTSYAFYNLFQLGKCSNGIWLYSDTDSCYSTSWNLDKVKEYNNECIRKLKKRGYNGIQHNGRTYYLGIAETNGDEDIYTEFRYQGAKRYVGRQKADGKLHITVAGVPKKTGAKCLKDDINNFVPGFIFPGSETGKKTHYFIYKEEIEIDENGNEIGDSLDLCSCDYLLSSVYNPPWEEVTKEWLQIEQYD